jgi:hypothetical protein
LLSMLKNDFMKLFIWLVFKKSEYGYICQKNLLWPDSCKETIFLRDGTLEIADKYNYKDKISTLRAKYKFDQTRIFMKEWVISF